VKLLTSLPQLGEWSRVYSCVWCGNTYQVFSSDVQCRAEKNYGDWGEAREDTDVFFAKCECGREIKIGERDMNPSFKLAIKTRGMFPKQPITLKLTSTEAPLPVPTHMDVEPTLLGKLYTRLTEWF
jgi:hypothetical protein